MLFAPFFGEFAGDCGGEDGLAKALEYVRYLLKALFHGVDAGHDGIQLGDDAFLLVEGWKRKINFIKINCFYIVYISASR